MVAQVIANIELEPEEIISAIIKEYNYSSVLEVTMDEIRSYVNDHITNIKPYDNPKGINEVYMGYSIAGFEEHTYRDIEEILEKMQDKVREEQELER